MLIFRKGVLVLSLFFFHFFLVFSLFFFCLLRSTSLCFVTVKGKDALRLQSELFSLSLSPCTWLFSICARILLRTVRKEREYYTNFFFSFVCVAYVMKSAETGPKSSKWRRRRRVRERVILSLVNTVSCTCRHTVVPMPCMNFVVRKATLLCYVSFFFFMGCVCLTTSTAMQKST